MAFFRINLPKILIEYIPLQQGLRLLALFQIGILQGSLSIFHYNKD
ncbi:hypothetical protein HMPREF9419_1388 [Prevotella nigrescens ATCC 33563]|nr:hypothetical protein HMPREF9419_1388 [Prevotella nigrescens ATCC 33563]